MADRPKLLRDAWRLVTPHRGEEREATRLSYASGDRAFLWVLLSLCFIEGLGLYLLLRGTWIGVPLGVLDVVSLPYVLGMIATTKAYPHLLLADRLVLRSGAGFRLDVPIANVLAMRPHFRLRDAAAVAVDGDRLVIPQSGSTNMEITLREPMETALGQVRAVAFGVDERHRRRLRDHDDLVARSG